MSKIRYYNSFDRYNMLAGDVVETSSGATVTSPLDFNPSTTTKVKVTDIDETDSGATINVTDFPVTLNQDVITETDSGATVTVYAETTNDISAENSTGVEITSPDDHVEKITEVNSGVVVEHYVILDATFDQYQQIFAPGEVRHTHSGNM